MNTSFALDIQRILPEITLSLFGIIIILLDTFLAAKHKHICTVVSLTGILTSAICTTTLVGETGTAFSGMITIDAFGSFFRFIFLLIGGMTVLASAGYLKRESLPAAEYQSLILFAIVGMDLMVASDELIMIFLGLETLSVASYILLGIQRVDLRSIEASIKYFLLGSFSSAFLLYGIALTYGATRTTNLAAIARSALSGSSDMGLTTAAIGLMFVGLGFKIAAAPFHVWTPDVYEGAPTPITGFMSAGPKAAGFAVLIRIFLTAFPQTYTKWVGLVWVSAVLTMVIGNVVALRQSNIKRMLAYSSIAHAGYILVAVATASQEGIAAVLFYTLVYALMNIGAFTIVALVSGKGEHKVSIDDFSGLGSQQPFLAAALSLFLLSLAGIPLTAGFLGKFFIFRAAIEANFVWLAVIGVINSAISVYYYLRVIIVLYMKEASADWSPIPLSLSAGAVILLAAGATIQIGVFPELLVDLARTSAMVFR